MAEGVPVAAAIEALRSELEAALTVAQDKELRFEATAIELTLQAAVTMTGGAHAGVKWWLIDAGVEGSRESATTQTITLSLTPKVITADGTTGPVMLEGTD
jgi:hypothetical protein